MKELIIKYKLEIYYGTVIGLLVFAWLILEFIVGLHDKYLDVFVVITNFVLLIPTIGIYLAIRKKKKSEPQQHLTFKQGFQSGLFISVLFTIIAAIGQFIYHKVINRGYFEFMIDKSLDRGIKLEEAQSYFNTSSYVMSVVISYFIFGVIISLIVSAIMKSKANNSSLQSS